MKTELIHLLEKSNKKFRGALISINIEEYIDKIIAKASIHSIFVDKKLIAFIAYYENDPKKEKAYLSMIAVHPDHVSQGYGKSLLDKAINNLKEKRFKFFELEVLKSNIIALEFYKKYNFKIIDSNTDTKYYMKKDLSKC
jgi:ribosomal-protein-alanine N-acetyltransferase